MSAIGYYNRFSTLYDMATLRDWFYRAPRRSAIDALHLSQGDTVFDLFCGTGVNLPLLREQIGRSGRIVALDGSEGMLEQARAALDGDGADAPETEFLRADFTTEEGIRTVVAAVRHHAGRKYLFTLGLTCLPNWREFFSAVHDAAPPGSRFAILDVYSQRLTAGARLINRIGAGDCRRPVWEELEARAADSHKREFRPFFLLDVGVVVAHGQKPRRDQPASAAESSERQHTGRRS